VDKSTRASVPTSATRTTARGPVMNCINIIHCDKCDSTNVLHEQVVLKPQEVHVTMTQMAEEEKKPKMSYDVYYYTRYKMICKDCGHIVEYQR
jgi:hypothetical protein